MINNYAWSLLNSNSEILEEDKTVDIRINNSELHNYDWLIVNPHRNGAQSSILPKSILDQDENSVDSNTNSFDSESMEWRIGDFINKGSIGEVFRALDCNSAKLIAIKFLDWNELSKHQIEELLYQLKGNINKIKEEKHQNIIRYLTVSEEEGEEDKKLIAILMEYVPGDSIECILKYFKSFKEPLAKIYISHVVHAVFGLHKRGVIHGDIKTSNLLVDDLGVVKLSDFGFIKSLYADYQHSVQVNSLTNCTTKVDNSTVNQAKVSRE